MLELGYEYRQSQLLYIIMLQQSCLIVQTVCTVLERDPIRRFNYGCLNALAYALQSAAICIRLVMLFSDSSSSSSHDTSVVLEALGGCAAVICSLACLSLPRRPAVEEGGFAVDGQYTVSALGRYTFFWPGVTLVLARKKKTLGLEDLPRLHVKGRSAYRQKYFTTLKRRDQLWKTLAFAHLPELLFQTAFTALQSTAQFAPQLVLYQLLKRLESRVTGASADRTIWGLVIALGVAIIFSGWTQAWMAWIVWARLGQPIRTELSAMIFDKATRSKDVKGVQKAKQDTDVDAVHATNVPAALSETDDQSNAETHPVSGSAPGQAGTAMAKDFSEEDVQKSRQSTINLVVRFVS